MTLLDHLLPTTRSTTGPGIELLGVGRRIDIVKNRTAPILLAHQVEDDNTTHYLEYPFRHFHAAVLENSSVEYCFISDFFAHKSFDQALAIFHRIFEPTFALGKDFTKTLIEGSHDALGILLCVRLNQDAAFEMQKRRVPAADGYINAINMLLWPRMQIIMDLHCESLSRAASAIVGMKALSGIGGPLGIESSAPDFLTQRFATFVHGILALSTEAGNYEPVANSLARLRSEFEAFLTKLGNGIIDTRKRERFMLNNYSLVLTIIDVQFSNSYLNSC